MGLDLANPGPDHEAAMLEEEEASVVAMAAAPEEAKGRLCSISLLDRRPYLSLAGTALLVALALWALPPLPTAVSRPA